MEVGLKNLKPYNQGIATKGGGEKLLPKPVSSYISNCLIGGMFFQSLLT